MDERTRGTDDDLAPNLRRTAPDPGVTTRHYSRLQLGIALAVALALIVAAYVVVKNARAPQPANPRAPVGGTQAVGAATVTLGNIRAIVNALGHVKPLATL